MREDAIERLSHQTAAYIAIGRVLILLSSSGIAYVLIIVTKLGYAPFSDRTFGIVTVLTCALSWVTVIVLNNKFINPSLTCVQEYCIHSTEPFDAIAPWYCECGHLNNFIKVWNIHRGNIRPITGPCQSCGKLSEAIRCPECLQVETLIHVDANRKPRMSYFKNGKMPPKEELADFVQDNLI